MSSKRGFAVGPHRRLSSAHTLFSPSPFSERASKLCCDSIFSLLADFARKTNMSTRPKSTALPSSSQSTAKAASALSSSSSTAKKWRKGAGPVRGNHYIGQLQKLDIAAGKRASKSKGRKRKVRVTWW